MLGAWQAFQCPDFLLFTLSLGEAALRHSLQNGARYGTQTKGRSSMQWIVTDNIYDETWRRLLEFANIDLTFEDIVSRHGKPLSKSIKENYLKQAYQVRACVLQAKEYFDAARQSSIFTAPNHFYYGMVSLSSMMMLILGTGKHSLDYLRRDKNNSHHGLIFSTGCNSSQASEGLLLIEKSWAEVTPAGHFMNWYSVLPSRAVHYALRKEKFAGGSSMRLVHAGGTSTVYPNNIVGRKKSILQLLRFLPDLYFDLNRYGITVVCAKTNHEIYSQNTETLHYWLIHEMPDLNRLPELLESFSALPRHAHRFEFNATDDGRVWRVSFSQDPQDNALFNWPSPRETMSHESISYADNIDTHEIVDCLMLAFQLSMLSRYYPDLWFSCLESHCKAAKLIERAIDLLILKAPIMALSMVWKDDIIISTHRAPWW
jgi:hypothetical protein